MTLNANLLALGAATAFVVAAPASAAEGARSIEIAAGPLGGALREFAREARVELLFSDALVAGRRAQAVRGPLSAEQALQRLLQGSGLGYRRTPAGALVIFALPDIKPPPESEPIPEILVVGRRTQNADIRRTESDIQPYKVYNGKEVREAHRDNLEQFFQARETANALVASPSLDALQLGETRSAVDLRALGEERTLVLIDGRRVPGRPTNTRDPQQPDVNAIPLSAIDRVETLTGTAGGIYGPNALGGVVNIVLKRDYDGAALQLISGLTSRGDAGSAGVEGHFGFSPNGGRTNIMLAGAHRRISPLRYGDRDFDYRKRQRLFATDPIAFLYGRHNTRFPVGNAVTVVAADNRELVLKPEYGGGSLGSLYSYLPIGFSGDLSQALSTLKANAGQLVLEPGRDGNNERRFNGAQPTYTSALLNVRHSIDHGLELYVDGLLLKNRGHYEIGDATQANVTLPNAPTNPFQNHVLFLFPRPAQKTEWEQTQITTRVTAGLIADLPHGWGANADLTFGKATLESRHGGPGARWQFPLRSGTPGGSGGRVVNPLGPWSELVEALAAYTRPFEQRTLLENRMIDATVRIAGPVLSLPGGPLAGTLLAEHRSENIPAARMVERGAAGRFTTDYPARRQSVRSFYGELRAPIGPRGAAFPLLRELEVQVAIRSDRKKIELPGPYPTTSGIEVAPRSDRTSITYVAGIRASPMDALKLRASIATGEQMLPVGAHFSRRNLVASSGLQDPSRAEQFILVGRIPIRWGWSPDSKPELARTISIGGIVEPLGERGPRVSVDYSNIRQTRQPFLVGGPIFLTFERATALARFVLEHEQDYAGAVTRAPLSDADRALGFTVGPVTAMELRGLATWTVVTNTVDLRGNWRIPLASGSEVQLRAAVTWLPTSKSRLEPFGRFRNYAGYSGEALEWRGNAAVEWTSGSTTLGLGAQYYGRQKVAYRDGTEDYAEFAARANGGRYYPSQLYFDLNARHRFRVGPLALSRAVEASVGIINLFDQPPPLDVDPQGAGYSYYGDPRRRRFELRLSSEF